MWWSMVGQASMEEIVESAKAANIHEFIMASGRPEHAQFSRTLATVLSWRRPAVGTSLGI